MTSKTAAIRYARALFDVALREHGDLARVDQEMAGVNALLDREPALKKVMLNPAVPVPRKRAAMAELTTLAGTSPIVSKLLALLAERDRLVILPDLAAAFRDRLNAHRNIVRAQITTATSLPDVQAKAIEQRLAAATGRTVTMETRVDPGILGGLVARVGGTVYDGSIARQLEKMKQRLIANA